MNHSNPSTIQENVGFLRKIFNYKRFHNVSWLYYSQKLVPPCIDVLLFMFVLMRMKITWNNIYHQLKKSKQNNQVNNKDDSKSDSKSDSKDDSKDNCNSKENCFSKFNETDNINFEYINKVKISADYKNSYNANSNQRIKQNTFSKNLVDSIENSVESSFLEYNTLSLTSNKLSNRLKRDFNHYCRIEANEPENELSIREMRISSLVRLGFLIGRTDRIFEQYIEGIFWIFYHLLGEVLFSQSFGELFYFSIVGELLKSFGLIEDSKRSIVQKHLPTNSNQFNNSGLFSTSGKRVRLNPFGGTFNHQRKVKIVFKFGIVVLIQWLTNFIYDLGFINAILRIVLFSKSKAEKIFDNQNDFSYSSYDTICTYITFIIKKIELLNDNHHFRKQSNGNIMNNSKNQDINLTEISNYNSNIKNIQNNQIDTMNNKYRSSIVLRESIQTLVQMQKWCSTNSSNYQVLEIAFSDLEHFHNTISSGNEELILQECSSLQVKYSHLQFLSYGLIPWWNSSSLFIGFAMGNFKVIVRFLIRYLLSILFGLVSDKSASWLYHG